jgi:hypothetical protein
MRKADNVTLSDIYERNLFYVCDDLEEMQEIARNGFKCVQTLDDDKNQLGKLVLNSGPLLSGPEIDNFGHLGSKPLS